MQIPPCNMTHKQFSSKGGKTMTEKRYAALLKNAAKARAAKLKKQLEKDSGAK